MTEDLDSLLQERSFKQLKDIAEKFDVDCEGCRSKKDYIETIRDSQKVAISDVEDFINASSTSEEESTAKDSEEGKEDVPDFTDAMNLLSQTKERFDRGDYIVTIDHAMDAITAGEKALKSYYGVGLSLAVKSSEAVIDIAKKLGIEASEAEDALSKARTCCEESDFEKACDIVSELRGAIKELQKLQNEKVSELITNIQSMIADTRNLGGDVSEVESPLDEAREMLEQDRSSEAAEKAKEAEEKVKEAHSKRVNEISMGIEGTQKIIDDAKFINAPVSEAEEMLEEARKAFEAEEYLKALENTKDASESAIKSRDEQLNKAMSMYQKLKPGTAIVGAEWEAAEQETVEEETPETFEEMAEEEETAFEMEESEETPAVTQEEPSEIEEKIEKEICPKCGGELSYIEKDERYYCYTCEDYAVPAEKPVEEAIPTEEKKVCPNCGEEPTYIEKYKQHYCYTCKMYVEPKAKGAVEEAAPAEEEEKVCPNCGGEPTYIEKYKQHYCYTCKMYVEPKAKGAVEEAAPAEEEEKVCPNCGEEPTYIEKYKQHYCYTCKEYVEPTTRKEAAKPKKRKPEKICPNCEGKVTFVDKYKQYYCYSCKEYVEPK